MTIYEIKGMYMELLAMSQDPDVDPQTVADTLEGMEGLLEEKAEGYGRVLVDLTNKMDGIDREIKRMQARKKSIESNITRMKESLKNAIQAANLKNVRTEHFLFTVKGVKPKLVIDDENKVPDQFKVPVPAKVDKDKLLSYIKEHGATEYAHTAEGQTTLQMR